MITRPAPEIWEAALGQLQLEVSKANFRTWLSKTTGMECQDKHFVVGVPNTFIAEYLEKNQRSLIEKALTVVLKDEVKVEFRVATSLTSAHESDLSTRARSTEVSAPIGRAADLWSWLIYAALAVLLLEWTLYHRRVTS